MHWIYLLPQQQRLLLLLAQPARTCPQLLLDACKAAAQCAAAARCLQLWQLHSRHPAAATAAEAVITEQLCR
jgi:hypothetical protein